MAKIFNFFANIFYTLAAGFIGGSVGTLALLFSFTAVYQRPIVTVLVAAAYLPFHLSDLKKFWKERDWLLIASRFVLLTVICSFLVGLFGFTLGVVHIEWFTLVGMMVAAPILFILSAAYVFLACFFPTSRVFVGANRMWDDHIRGGKAYGVFWDS